jgi:16S rRNA (cytidine1402-2'-O)-methyltransferase
MLRILGEREATICREITKIHEEVIPTTLSSAVSYYEENKPRGEFVLVIKGAEKTEEKPATMEDALLSCNKLAGGGAPLSEAAGKAAAATGLRKTDIYKAAIEQMTGNN